MHPEVDSAYPLMLSICPVTLRERQQRVDRVRVVPECGGSWDGKQLLEPKGVWSKGPQWEARLGPVQSSGQKWSWEQQRQETTQPHHLHKLSAGGAGKGFPEDTLSRCVCTWAAGSEDRPDRSPGAGRHWELLFSPLWDFILSTFTLDSDQIRFYVSWSVRSVMSFVHLHIRNTRGLT